MQRVELEQVPAPSPVYHTKWERSVAATEIEPGLRMVRAAGRKTEPYTLRRVRIQVLVEIQGSRRLPKDKD